MLTGVGIESNVSRKPFHLTRGNALSKWMNLASIWTY